MTASTTRKGTTTSATKAPAPKPAPAKKVAPPAPPAGTVIVAKTQEEYDQLKNDTVARAAAIKAATPAPAEDKPTWAAAKAMGKGKAFLFRQQTLQIALAKGYKDVSQAPFGNVAIFEKGNVRFTVTYSEQDFVRKVEGPVTILPGDADKWKKLNAALVANA